MVEYFTQDMAKKGYEQAFVNVDEMVDAYRHTRQTRACKVV